MKQVSNKLLLAAAMAALLAGCDSGGINIEPTTNSPSPAPSPNPQTPTYDGPCASYEKEGTILHGDFDEGDGNCVYLRSFVDAGNPLTTDLTIPALEDGGAHVFFGSLVVGENHTSNAELAAAGITQGGDGPKLEVAPGVTIAFNSSSEALVINRGSQIFAEGTETAPITVTSLSDVNGELADNPEAVGEWGGMVINGFGVTNKCSYTGSVGVDLALTGECNVDIEGLIGDATSSYGGDNNADSSGVLRYFRIKHTGFDVVPGNELNGIAFGAVGSGTTLENIQAFATQDDGVEFFGGAVNMTNYVGMYVNDDSIDIDEGYRGTITNALVIQGAASGANCIESDGIGSYKAENVSGNADIIARGLNSRPVIDGLTCIISPVPFTDDPGAGWRFREGIFPTVTNSMIIASFNAADVGSLDDNYCLRIDNSETLQGAEDGDVVLKSNIFACEEKTKPASLPGGQTLEAWASVDNVFATISGAVDPTAMNNTELQILEGATLPIFSIDTDSMMVDGAAVSITPQNDRGYLGALSQADVDWTSGWTIGLDENLWIKDAFVAP